MKYYDFLEPAVVKVYCTECSVMIQSGFFRALYYKFIVRKCRLCNE